MNQLVLFCGGPTIYPGTVPKPLQVMASGRTLLEWYLSTPFTAAFQSVVLLCEDHNFEQFKRLTGTLESQRDMQVVSTPEGSTTLAKLQNYVEESKGDATLTCTYPDIFFAGTYRAPGRDYDWDHRITLGIRPLSSRFPTLMVDPYSGLVQSITYHHPAVPANPVHIFGGMLIAKAATLSRLLAEFRDYNSGRRATLEFETFGWMINLGIADSTLLEGHWFQADGPRQIEEIKLHFGLA